jgi:thiamine pyrophosphate-dependent acetolactate synthase large subunit-like protein
MALPDRPVVAVVGDGSSIYGIQALWSAAHYKVGVLFVILSNGGYAIMDRLAERQGGVAPWPSFDVDVAALAREEARHPRHRLASPGAHEVVLGVGGRRARPERRHALRLPPALVSV